MELNRFLGIDPGIGGGVSLINSRGRILHYTQMPTTEFDIWYLFNEDIGCTDNLKIAYIEKVASMPKQGVVSMFTFGKNYGSLRMALTASLIPFEEVTPSTWQRGLKIPPKTKQETKLQH